VHLVGRVDGDVADRALLLGGDEVDRPDHAAGTADRCDDLGQAAAPGVELEPDRQRVLRLRGEGHRRSIL
jgi:hypothetical protein